MSIAHVFAKATTVASDIGHPVTVQGGSHWPADDPLVLARPDLFTEDCRYGLTWSGEPPAYMSEPPADEPPPADERDYGPEHRAARAAARGRPRPRATA